MSQASVVNRDSYLPYPRSYALTMPLAVSAFLWLAPRLNSQFSYTYIHFDSITHMWVDPQVVQRWSW